MDELLTVGDMTELLATDGWRIRKVVDAINCGVRRAGLYRLVPRSQLGTVVAELERRKWLGVRKSHEASHV